jgi:large subunit ribosomal protein L31
MKPNIHPKWYNDAKVIVNGQTVFVTGSTVPEMHAEIWSGTHPFYTGKHQLLDVTGVVDKFKKRSAAAATLKASAKPKKERKVRSKK